MNKKLSKIFGAALIAGSVVTSGAAFGFAGTGSTATTTGGSYTGFAPSPNLGSTEVNIGNVRVKCSNSDAISFGVVRSEDPLNEAYGAGTNSLKIGLTYTHVFGTSSKTCEAMARQAKRQTEMDMRLSWVKTVRETCREDLKGDLTPLEMLGFYRSLSKMVMGYDDPEAANNAVQMCRVMTKGSVNKPTGGKAGGSSHSYGR